MFCSQGFQWSRQGYEENYAIFWGNETYQNLANLLHVHQQLAWPWHDKKGEMQTGCYWSVLEVGASKFRGGKTNHQHPCNMKKGVWGSLKPSRSHASFTTKISCSDKVIPWIIGITNYTNHVQRAPIAQLTRDPHLRWGGRWFESNREFCYPPPSQKWRDAKVGFWVSPWESSY